MRKRRCNWLWIALVFALPAAGSEVEATLRWAQRVELSTPVSGQIERVLVDVGSMVGKGDALLELDARPFQAALDKAQADVAQARDALAEAEREVERAQELYDRTVLSVHELQLVQIAHTRARSELQRAQATLAQAQLDLEYSVIRAPFDAIVVQRRADPGQTVVTRLQSTPLLAVAERGRILARATVPSDQLRALRKGQALIVRVAGERYPGRVARLGMEPVSGEGAGARYPVDVEFAVRAEEGLRAGQPATLELP